MTGPSRPLAAPAIRAAALAVVLTVGGCVSTEPLEHPPTIEPSPEEIALTTADSDFSLTGSVGLRVTDHESDSLERLEVLPGARVADVVPGSSAARAGLRVGDVILRAAGIATNGREAFETVVRAVPAGGELAVEARRGTVVFDAGLHVAGSATARAATERYRIDPVRTRAGYRSIVDADRGRVLAEVVRLFPGSPLPDAGIGRGDRIAALDGKPVDSAQHLVTSLLEDRRSGERVEFTVVSGAGEHTTSMDLWAPPRRLTRLQLPLVVDYERRGDSTRFALVDLWVLKLFGYQRQGSERTYQFLFFKFGTGYGELTEETP